MQLYTNNNDIEKILAMLLTIIHLFSKMHPDAWIYFKGNNLAKTRLYRIVISKSLKEVGNEFMIYGFRDNNWYEFQEGTEFQAFLVRRKK